jgi:hypothetical protein
VIADTNDGRIGRNKSWQKGESRLSPADKEHILAYTGINRIDRYERDTHRLSIRR